MAATPEAPELVPAERLPVGLLLRHLDAFRKTDTSGDGSISAEELRMAFEASNITLTDYEFKKFMGEVDSDHSSSICFVEFLDVARKLASAHRKYTKSSTRTPRMYLQPEQFTAYATIFKEAAGDGLSLDITDLGNFLTERKIIIAPERLTALMTELDEDGSGRLEENEFMVLLIKSLGMKKRKVGPGLCSCASLLQEGWSASELRRAGYEHKDFLEAGYTHKLHELMDCFNPVELRKAGVSLKELLAAGWDCEKGREMEFALEDLFNCKCSVQRIRGAGYSDLQSAIKLRKLGVEAAAMRLGGFPLSMMRIAGYSTVELRHAGFSGPAITACQALLNKRAGVERQNTFQIREAAEQALVTTTAASAA